MNRRKELKLAYKLNPPPMGVCQIKNKVNGKVFLASSMNLHGKNNSWHFQLNANCHPNKALQADWSQYGPDAFTFEILETIKSEELAQDEWREATLALEEKWLCNLQPYGDKGYNKLKS